MPNTIIEKIISRLAGKRVTAGCTACVRVGLCVCNDLFASALLPLLARVKFKRPLTHCVLSFDCAGPSPRADIAELHARLRVHAAANGVCVIDVGQGISNWAVMERKLLKPGMYAATCGVSAPAFGSIQAAIEKLQPEGFVHVLRKQMAEVVVPETIRIQLFGRPKKGVTASDIAMGIAAGLGKNVLTGKSLELKGPFLTALPESARITISAVLRIAGAAQVFFVPHGMPDITGDAYNSRREYDISDMMALAVGMEPASIQMLSDIAGTPVQEAFLGGYGASSFDDMVSAAKMLARKKVHPQVKFYVAPGSSEIFLKALDAGIIRILARAGAIILPPGCGPAEGLHQGVPADGETVVAAAGYGGSSDLGNPKSQVWSVSAEVVVASAIAARIHQGKQ